MRGTNNVEKIDEILNWKYGFETLLDLYKDKDWNNSLTIAKNEDGFITLDNYVVDLAIETIKNKKEGIFILDMNSKQKIDNAYELLIKSTPLLVKQNNINIQNFKIAILGSVCIYDKKPIHFLNVVNMKII